MKQYEVIIIGAGPAGMAAAYGARRGGASDILLLERQKSVGGVLNQCIHDGFGTALYEKSYTGPEYGEIWKEKIAEFTEIRTDTAVIKVESRGFVYQITCIGGASGREVYIGKTVIFAMGCRERTVGQLRIPGSRPAGIYTAGCAQYMMNIQNMKPGKSAVIFGTGDIGLIMARRLILEGIQVKLIFGDRAAGLARNYVQCVRDFQIPLKLGYTLLRVHGYDRLKGVTIAPLGNDGKPLLEQKQYVPCDTLLTAVGLISETELFREMMPELEKNRGIPVDTYGQTQFPGIFACGNVTQIYDLADYVTVSGIQTGMAASRFLGYNEKPIEEFSLSIKKERTFEGMEKHTNYEMVCVNCPKGCLLQANMSNGNCEVTGNECSRGYAYAIDELKRPKRILTTTARIKNQANLLLPVRTDKPVDREKMREIIILLNRKEISLPVKKGQRIVDNIPGIDANIIASKSMGIKYET